MTFQQLLHYTAQSAVLRLHVVRLSV